MSETHASSYVFDASLWVSRLVPKDPLHRAVTGWLDAQRSRGAVFYAPSLLLPEAAGAISRRTGAPELGNHAVERLQALPELRIVQMSQSLVELAAHVAAVLSLRGAVSLYVALAAHLDLPLATLDSDQAQRSAPSVQVLGAEVFSG
jgi:predicted nucleic acid-binding protein